MPLYHPQFVNGRALIVDPEVEDIVHRLHYGDPTLGWEGDPALALYRSKDSRWELWRLEEDGEYRMVCRSAEGLPLDQRLIVRLMEHDARRGHDLVDLVAKTELSNQAMLDRREKRETEQTAAVLEKVIWGLHKDNDENAL